VAEALGSFYPVPASLKGSAEEDQVWGFSLPQEVKEGREIIRLQQSIAMGEEEGRELSAYGILTICYHNDRVLHVSSLYHALLVPPDEGKEWSEPSHFNMRRENSRRANLNGKDKASASLMVFDERVR
jgi:hypothetical protein